MEGLILVVDDDPLFRESVSEALAAQGLPTRAVATKDEALTTIESERPALVLLDVSIPTGADRFVRELAARDIQIPVVVVTDQENGEAQARRFGAAAYLKRSNALRGLLGAVAACRPSRLIHRRRKTRPDGKGT